MRIIVAAVALALMGGSALSQVPCANRKIVEKNLQEKYGEALIAYGKANGEGEGVQGYVEIWASPKRTFTLVFRQEGKEVSCIVGGGNDLTFRTPQIGGEDL